MLTMTAWMEKPLNMAVADFEFLLFTDGTFFPLQVAIANGYGSWIVPRSTINHRVTKRALLEKVHLLSYGNQRGMWVSLVHKFYTGDLDDTTEGLTCHEIAELINQYTKV
jgi:hypothetical protein